MKYVNKYFAYFHPSEHSSCTITSATAQVTSTTWLLQLGYLEIKLLCNVNCWSVGAHVQFWGCPHGHPSIPGHVTACVHQVALKLYHLNMNKMFKTLFCRRSMHSMNHTGNPVKMNSKRLALGLRRKLYIVDSAE